MENIVSFRNKLLLKILDFFCHFFCKKEIKNENYNMHNAKKIIIVCYTLIGDAVMLLPFIQAIHNNLPGSEITIVCDHSVLPIYRRQNIVDNYIAFKLNSVFSSPISILKNLKVLKGILKSINKETYDVAIEPRGDLRFILFMHKFHALNKISYGTTGGEYLLTKTIKNHRRLSHVVEFELNILKELGLKIDKNDKIPHLVVTLDDRVFKQQYLSEVRLNDQTLITGLHPGASLEIKRWRHYAELITMLHNQNKNQVFLLFQGPKEENAIRDIKELLVNKKINLVIVHESLDKYMTIISLCDRMICNDSGAGHIATAFGIPTVILYGPTEPELALPYSTNKVEAISHPYPCKPCSQRTCKYKTIDCLNSIKAEEVYNKVVSELEGSCENT